MLRYSIRLTGPGEHGARISGALLRDLLDVLSDSVRAALRLAVDGRSNLPGTHPAWLQRAADFDVLGFRAGSTVIELEQQTLAEAVVDRFGQEDLFHPVDPGAGALSLLQASLADALHGREDSDRLDEPLLDRLEAFGRVFKHRVAQIEITNDRSDRELVTIRPEGIQTIRRLRQETPPDQRVRVAGWLDSIRHSDRMFSLKLESGSTLRGVAVDVDPERLAALFGKRAVVSGMASFRPSGRILRIEADHLEPAGADFSLWSVEPEPLFREAARADLRVAQGPRSGLNAVLGAWPGDESDEELHRILGELS